MSRLDTILNPQDNDIVTLRAERAPTPRSSRSSPTSSASEASRNSHRDKDHQEAKEHCAHPTCPDALRCLPDTDGRPQHTLPIILRCAILGSKMKRLTIREIYAAMEEKYPYYRTAGSTWKQSVRHHLSLNRLFERQPRPVSDPGFGSYWTVNLEAPPGTKRPRKRGRPQREVNGDGEPAPAKKRGRPRKMPETESSRRTELRRIATLPIPSVEHVGAHISVSSTRTGSRRRYEDEEEEDPKVPSELGASWCREEDLESEDEPPQRPITPAYDRAVTIRFSPSPIRETVHPLQDDYNSDAFPENFIDHLRIQMGMLRRQASEARAEAARMAQQLLESQAEVSKARIALKVAEDVLEAEVRKRREAEGVAEEETRLREAVEDELQTLQGREPGTLGGGG